MSKWIRYIFIFFITGMLFYFKAPVFAQEGDTCGEEGDTVAPSLPVTHCCPGLREEPDGFFFVCVPEEPEGEPQCGAEGDCCGNTEDCPRDCCPGLGLECVDAGDSGEKWCIVPEEYYLPAGWSCSDDPNHQPCEPGLACIDGKCVDPTDMDIRQFEGILRTVTSILYPVAIGIGFFIIIKSGYQFMTSEGDPRKVAAAREDLTSAIIGILFVALSVVILNIAINLILGL